MNLEEDGFKLEAPDQDLKTLSFCGSDIKKLSGWIDNLSLFNLDESTSALFQALNEVARLRVDEKKRMSMLSVLNIRVVNVSYLLDKSYLNKPLILPYQAKEAANALQVIESQAVQAYKVVIANLLKASNTKKELDLVCIALERAMYFLSQSLLRCYQLYVSVPSGLWRDIHYFYRLAEHNGCLDVSIKTKLFKGTAFSTVGIRYKQAVFLAISKPNQIRQKEIRVLHNAFSHWHQWINLTCDKNSASVYAVDLSSSGPPQMIEHIDNAQVSAGQLRYMVAGQLVSKIKAHLDGSRCVELAKPSGQSPVFDPQGASIDLLSRLQTTLCHSQSRQHKRLPTDESVLCTSGYASVHRCISDSYNVVDDGSSALFTVVVENVSASGYCLSFDSEKECYIKPDELTAIYYEHSQRWVLGIVRWVEQFKSGGAQAGVQLLARYAYSCDVRSVSETESTDFAPGFILLQDNATEHQGDFNSPLVFVIVPFENGGPNSNIDVRHRGNTFSFSDLKQISCAGAFRTFQLGPKQGKDLIKRL